MQVRSFDYCPVRFVRLQGTAFGFVLTQFFCVGEWHSDCLHAIHFLDASLKF